MLLLHEPLVNHMSPQHIGKRKNPLDGLDTPCLDGGMSFSSKTADMWGPKDQAEASASLPRAVGKKGAMP